MAKAERWHAAAGASEFFEMSDFKKLEVWQKAHMLALEAHSVAVKIRGAQYISLRSQLIRAAMSIPANIVEGREQKSDKDFARFLRYALGSTSELEYHLIVGRDMKLISQDAFEGIIEKLQQVRRMLNGFLSVLEKDASQRTAVPLKPQADSLRLSAGGIFSVVRPT